MNKRPAEPLPNTMRGKVLAYVRANPECTTPELRDKFGLELDNLCNMLRHLRTLGFVISEKIPGQAAHLWTAVADLPPELAEANGEARRAAIREDAIRRAHLPVKRRVVKEWTGHARDDWHNLFFGPAQVAA